MTPSPDLIIIGAGPGGYETALHAAREGLHVVLIEAQQLGGTCLNVGCIPTKCLCKNAQVLHDLREGERWGLTNLSYGFDLRRAIARKDEVVEGLRSGVATLLRHPNLRLIFGRAEFIDDHTVRVPSAHDCDGAELVDFSVSAPHIIIATGSVAKSLDIPGAHLPRVLTSTEMLHLNTVPRRLCIIGGGVIGMEFASIFAAFGSEVTVLEFCKEMLPNFEPDLVKRMRPAFKRSGITLVNQAAVTAIEPTTDDTSDTLSVVYDQRGHTERIEADIVLMAVGRQPNVEGLGLEHTGIAYDARGIQTDDDLRTSVKGIYAIGDVNGQCQLAHAATFQGKRVLQQILHRNATLRLDLIPAAIFTTPEAASVGPTEAACRAQGLDIQVRKAFFRTNGKALAMGEAEGMVKIIADSHGQLLAGHLFGPHAADLIQELVPMIARGCTLSDLAFTIHAHPTLGEVLLAAAEE